MGNTNVCQRAAIWEPEWRESHWKYWPYLSRQQETCKYLSTIIIFPNIITDRCWILFPDSLHGNVIENLLTKNSLHQQQNIK